MWSADWPLLPQWTCWLTILLPREFEAAEGTAGLCGSFVLLTTLHLLSTPAAWRAGVCTRLPLPPGTNPLARLLCILLCLKQSIFVFAISQQRARNSRTDVE